MSPFKTILFFVAVSVIGLSVLPLLSIDLTPNTAVPKLTISFSLPNALPEVLEQEATGPLENAFSQISGIRRINSISGQDQGAIELTFDPDVDLEFKKIEVIALLRELYPKLHRQLSYPTVEQRDYKSDRDKPLLVYDVNAKFAPNQINNVVQSLFLSEISSIPEVRSVTLSGAEGRQVSVVYDLAKIERYKLSVDEVKQALADEFNTTDAGAATFSDGKRLHLRVDKSVQSVTELENVTIPLGGHLIKLKDVGKISLEEKPVKHYFRSNGRNSIALAIYTGENVNRLVAAQRVKTLIGSIRAKLPTDYFIDLTYDDTEFLSQEIAKAYSRTGMTVLILVLFILVLYRSLRYLSLVISTTLVSLCMTSLVCYFFDVGIHLYSLAGITVAMSLIMNNAVLIVHHLNNRPHSNQVRLLITMTLATLVSLSAILVLPMEERENLTDLTLTVAISLACSAITWLFFTPVTKGLIKQRATRWKGLGKNRLSLNVHSVYVKLISFIASHRRVFLTLVIVLFGLPMFLLPSKWEGHPWYNEIVGGEFYKDKIRPHTDRILGGAFRLFVRNFYERSGYRSPEKTRLIVEAALPVGNTLEDMNRLIEQVEAYLEDTPGINTFITRVASGQQANIIVMFEEGVEKGPFPTILKAKVIARSRMWSGVEWRIYGIGQGYANGLWESTPNFKVEMRGYNYSELDKHVNKLAERLQANQRVKTLDVNAGLGWAEKGTTTDAVYLDIKRLMNYGIVPTAVARRIHDEVDDWHSGLFTKTDHGFLPVTVRSSAAGIFSSSELLQNTVTVERSSFRIRDYGTVRIESTPSSIQREDRQYIRSIEFEYLGQYEQGKEYLEEILLKTEKELPIGFVVQSKFWWFDDDQVKNQFGLVSIAIVGIMIVCFVSFEDLRRPFIVIMSIPVSFIGVFASFGYFEYYFDQGGYAALFFVMGLTANGSVYILSDSRLMKDRAAYNRLLLKRMARKSQPICLALISVCLGMLPFLAGGENEPFWFSFAIGTIGGLIFALFSILIFTPVMAFSK